MAVTQKHNFDRSGPINRILIADRNLLFRRGLRVLLAKEPEFTFLEDASDATETLSKVRMDNPDVLVITLDLLLESDKQLGFSLRKTKPNLAILVLAQNDAPENLQKSIEAGARGYMLKDTSPAQLIKGVKQVALSNGQDPADISATLPDLQALAAQTPAQERVNLLTSREQEVVKLLAEGRTVRAVAKELSLSIKTVEAHKLNLMRKLNIHNRTSLVEYAVREGMVEV